MLRRKYKAFMSANINNKSSLLADETNKVFEYTFEFPFSYSLYGNGIKTGAEYEENNPGEDAPAEIIDALQKAFDNDRISGVFDDVASSFDEEIEVTKFSLEVTSKHTIYCHVTTGHKLSDSELKILVDRITGQMSDGYGEGFEQDTITSMEADWDIEDYDEYGEYSQGKETANMDVYVHLWYFDEEDCPKWDIKCISKP